MMRRTIMLLLKDSISYGEYSVAAIETMHHNPRRVPVFQQHLRLTVALIIVECEGDEAPLGEPPRTLPSLPPTFREVSVWVVHIHTLGEGVDTMAVLEEDGVGPNELRSFIPKLFFRLWEVAEAFVLIPLPLHLEIPLLDKVVERALVRAHLPLPRILPRRTARLLVRSREEIVILNVSVGSS